MLTFCLSQVNSTFKCKGIMILILGIISRKDVYSLLHMLLVLNNNRNYHHQNHQNLFLVFILLLFLNLLNINSGIHFHVHSFYHGNHLLT